MNETVRNLLNEQVWYIATCGDEPNVVPVGFHGAVNAKGALLVTPEKVIVAASGPDNNKII